MMNKHDTVSCIQISDTHIIADPNERFAECDSYESLQQLIEFINTHDIEHDLVIVTGDLVHKPHTTAYERLLSLLIQFNVPVYCLPGNHDNPCMMHAVLNHANVNTQKQMVFNHWQIILLDSHQANTHAGYVKQEEFEFVKNCIKQHPSKHVLIAIHHPAIPVHSRWMDSMMLENATEFLDCINTYPQIKTVILGHVHQELETIRAGVTHLACPSTCVQFKPFSEHYEIDAIPAGFRQIILSPNAKQQHLVHRLI